VAMASRARQILRTGAALAAALGLAQGAAAQSAQYGLTIKDAPPRNPAQPVRPAASAPNILVIMLDDVGYGQFGTFGGAVPSPSMDALAKNGLRFTRFHTSGICSPTRASLLTGRNPHNAGFGNVGEMSNGYEGYTGILPDDTATFVRVLQKGGYATAMLGKNHNTPADETGPAGPFRNWPTGMGFDYFYGFNGWGQSQWHPTLYEGTTIVPPHNDPEYTLNKDLAEKGIAWLRRINSSAPDKPWLLYVAPGATHAPLHVPKPWIERFRGQFDDGWDAYRERAFSRQKALGVIPKDTVLTPRSESVQAWASLSDEQKRINARQMEVFAGFAAETEHEMARIIAEAQSLNNGRETMVVYLLGDNGGSAEGGVGGQISELAPGNGLREESGVKASHLDDLGGPKFENHMPYGWAWANNTPFQYFKQVVSHLGAIRNPMIVSWPGRIKDPGATRNQFLHVMDIGPTLLEAAGMKMPESVDGRPQRPLDGVSALSTIDSAASAEVRLTQHFEVFANRGIYDRGWFASAKISDPWVVDRSSLDPYKVTWELYDLNSDYSQSRDLAASMPEKLRQMQDLWWTLAARNKVLPLDWRGGERMLSIKRPGRTSYTYHAGTVGIPETLAPNVRNRSWQITAQGSFKPADSGMIITQGGAPGGWAFHLDRGIATFDYNLMGIERPRIAASAPVPAGTRELSMRFAYDDPTGKRRGAGGTVTLLADGRAIGSGRLERTLPNFFSVNETLDVGADYGSPVAYYPFPAPFTGALEKVTVDLK
jgi:arylsulfatase A-like enzyme